LALRHEGIDILARTGLIPALLSEKERKREINRNNNRLLSAMEQTQTLKIRDASIMKSRSSKSQAVILAAKYGGKKFKRAMSQAKR